MGSLNHRLMLNVLLYSGSSMQGKALRASVGANCVPTIYLYNKLPNFRKYNIWIILNWNNKIAFSVK
jgi:hypothetical protein